MGDCLPAHRADSNPPRHRSLRWRRILSSAGGYQRDWRTVGSCHCGRTDYSSNFSRLLSIPHIQRIRFATKGLAVAPCRTIDSKDTWTRAFIDLTNHGRKLGKHVCLHTHFNHPNEITWVTKDAAKYLFKEGVVVRNQSVLLRGVNDNVETLGKLIKNLADINIQPVRHETPDSACLQHE